MGSTKLAWEDLLLLSYPLPMVLGFFGQQPSKFHVVPVSSFLEIRCQIQTLQIDAVLGRRSSLDGCSMGSLALDAGSQANQCPPDPENAKVHMAVFNVDKDSLTRWRAFLLAQRKVQIVE